jgi:hypothetical protein
MATAKSGGSWGRRRTAQRRCTGLPWLRERETSVRLREKYKANPNPTRTNPITTKARRIENNLAQRPEFAKRKVAF